MRTYRDGPGGRGLMLALLALAVCVVSSAKAQERRYLVEAGAAAAYQSFAGPANLKSAAGGLFRAGVWLPLNFSLEGEAEFASPKDEGSDDGISFKYFGASLLYNVPVGKDNWVHLKIGGGSNKYPDCGTVAPSQICGSAGVVSGGAGFCLGVTPVLLARGDMLLTRYKNAEHTQNLTNFGLNVGLSVMLGSKPI